MKFTKLCLTLIVSSFFLIPVAWAMEEDKQQIVNTKPKIESRLQELGIKLPDPAKPVSSFIPYVITGSNVYISGQLPVSEGTLQYKGKLGKDLKLKDGEEAAKICIYNVLAYLKSACEGDLERVQKCVRLGVWVNGTDDFMDQPKIANAASALINSIFGEKGQHVRAAVGSNSLPFGAAVEIEALFKLEEMSKL